MKRIGEVLHNKKVLVVLDDVDNSEQVKKLIGNGTLYPGSRILITTRDKDVLQSYKLEYHILEYEMEVMSIDHALQFFSKHAFHRNSPPKDYSDLSREIVFTTGTLPLALEVIGSLLYQKPQDEWEKTLEELRKAPHTNVYKKLKISYDALSFEQQQIFLDIACFFIHEDKTNAIYMWEDCGLLRKDGVNVLNNRCLIKIAENNTFRMHDQLRVLGREIVREEDRMNPGNRSRLWIHKEVLGAIKTKEMKKSVQVLDLDLRKSNLKDITSEEIGKFEDLRCLKLKGGTFVGDLANSLTKLRWIFWSDPPQSSKPTNLHLKNVVVLVLSHNDFIDDSKLQSLIQMASHLKVLSLESCHNISRTPDFSSWPNLERLTFDDCSRLREIDGSIGKLRRLIDLKIHSCCSLEGLPEEIGDLENLKYFSAQRCEMKKLPDSIWKLKALHEVYFLDHFDRLDSAYSWELPSAIGMLQKLEVLLVNCPKLKGQIPPEIGSLSCLRILNLSHTCVNEVPKTISMLFFLKRLELMDCEEIQELPALPISLTHLCVSSKSLRVVPDLSNLINLVELDLNNNGEGGDKLCTGELWWIGRLSKLTKLSLRLQNVPAPAELASLPLLSQLDMFGMDMQTCPRLPLSLQKLGLDNFSPIVSIFPNLRNLSCFELCKSPMQEFQLDGLQLPHLRQLIVQLCVPLKRLTLSSMKKLKDVVAGRSPKLVEIQFSGIFESLEDLTIEWCKSFQRLVYVGEVGSDNSESANEMSEGRLILPLRALNKLKSFELQGSDKIREIKIVDAVESWEVFKVWSCPLLQSLWGLPNLKNLRSLIINYCKRLQVVEGLDELEVLRRLVLSDCQSLEWLIDVSTTKLPNFCQLEISSCRKLREVEGGFEGSIQSFKNYKEQEQEQEQKSLSKQEEEPERHFKQEQKSHSKQEEQEQERHFKQEQEEELKPRRRLGGVSFKCLSFNSLSRCSFHKGTGKGPL